MRQERLTITSRLLVTILMSGLVVACDPSMEGPGRDDAELAAEDEELEDVDDLVDEPQDEEPSERPDQADDLAVDAKPTAITGTHKVCSVIMPNEWRDTIVVPNAWTATICNAHKNQVGAAGGTYQLGCMNDAGLWWGAVGGADPANNFCGW